MLYSSANLEKIESLALNQATWINLCLAHGGIHEEVNNMTFYSGNAFLYQLKKIHDYLIEWNTDLIFEGEPGESDILKVTKLSTGGIYSFLII